MTSEQQALLQKAVSSLEAARVLLENGFPEFAASRAYYAMFYIAEVFLEGEGLSFSKHSAVISAFGQQFARTGRVPVEFHRNLITAEQIRLQGDYQSQGNVSATQAQTLIDQATEFITLAEQQIQ
jgi:uncharacterized protein (UPF0332 family)